MPPLTTSAPVSLKISDSSIVISPATPPAGTVTYPYEGFSLYQYFSFTASGGSPPYTWTSNGTLPPGLTLGSDGTVSGTPTQVGSFAFSVTATDSAQPPMSSPPLPSQITIGVAPALTFSATPAPPPVVVNTLYGYQFNVTGGYLPLHWSVTGTLPPGLTLASDGSLNGTPTTTGNFTFTVTVTDSAPKPVSIAQQFMITVTLPPPPSIDNQEAPTGTVGSVYAPYQFTASNGLGPLTWSEAPPLTIGLTLDSSGVLSGTPTTAGHYPITLNVSDAAKRAATPFPTTVRVSLARPPATFTPTTGSMTIARSGHSATLLLTGKVLVAGGGNGSPDPTAELYDPATQTFTPTTGNMTEARSGHTATLLKLSSSTLLNYGKVLIVGSADMTAELFDPATSTFATTGSMHHARTSPTATLLNTGKVLIVGGNTTASDLTAELYAPATGTFSDTGSTTILRSGHTATLLLDGRVLIAGGDNTAELYDPGHGTFTPAAGTMTYARSGHTATLLGGADGVQDGSVLVIGTDGTADLYDPASETFAAVGSLLPSMHPSFGHTASLRSDGTVLAAGGYSSRWIGVCRFAQSSESAAALFAAESDGFTPTGALSTARDTQTATVLPDGSVVIIGGTHRSYQIFGSPFTGFRCVRNRTVLSSAEVFK